MLLVLYSHYLLHKTQIIIYTSNICCTKNCIRYIYPLEIYQTSLKTRVAKSNFLLYNMSIYMLPSQL